MTKVYTTDLKDCHRILKDIRISKKLSVSGLSKIANISTKTISRIEAGKNVHLSSLFKVIYSLGLEPEFDLVRKNV